jgi:hypothetical protein
MSHRDLANFPGEVHARNSNNAIKRKEKKDEDENEGEDYKKISFRFDGYRISIYVNGKFINSFTATSGRDGVTDAGAENYGPIPEGIYFIDPQDVSEGNWLRSLLGD